MATISIRWAARRKPRMAVAGALLLGLTLAGPAGVEATFPGQNGPLVFMRDDEHGFPQIWTSRSDLTHQRQLTNLAATSGWPVWSPDGERHRLRLRPRRPGSQR